jgi:ribosomal protein S25
LSKRNVFKWHKRFRKGREDANNEERQGAPIMTQTGENVVKIRELVQSVRWLTCRMIYDDLDMSKPIVRKILEQDLGMRKLAVKSVPQNLMEEQKDRHLTLCMDFVEQLQEDIFLDHVIVGVFFLDHVIVGYETCCYQ